MARRDPIAALRAKLRDATKDGFAGAALDELGGSLAVLIEQAVAGGAGSLAPLAGELARWRELGRHDRSVLLAKTMRMVAMLPARPAAPKRERRAAPARSVRDDVGALAGVGPALREKLHARGLATVEDLAYLLPSDYVDHRASRPISEITDGEWGSYVATVRSSRQGFFGGRFVATVETRVDGAPLVLRWFHRMGGLERLVAGKRVGVVGVVRWHAGKPTMAHPELYDPDEPRPAIGVRYAAVEGVPARTLARIVRSAVALATDDASDLVDALPPEIAKAQRLPGQRQALRWLHEPPADAPPEAIERLRRGQSSAHRRLAFEDFFFLELALLSERARWQAHACAVAVDPVVADRERVRACLPFEPTRAQWRVLDELVGDMASGRPMMRLLQGDVGSGKTMVAFAAALVVAASRGQTAIMAPTEILAEQHHRTLAPWCERAGLRVGLLTGSTPKAQRASLLALCGAGEVDLLVGTHALIVGDVAFARLGLAIVDEQHRFGVEQRALLRGKGDAPHLLVMTATPIPRTLALTAFGELEASVLDEMPPGRTPPTTELLAGRGALGRARARVAECVRAGERAFVVCPLVEESEAVDASHVEATAAAMRALLPDRAIGVVHGRMTARDKDGTMSAFRTGALEVLVATTVIEVGVDVPEANVILVEHAERFGLAQLHQLRGRVGRGGGASLCLLHTEGGANAEATTRLRILVDESDGFRVAEGDLALRGPGEVFGTRQAGVPRLRFAGFAGEGIKLLVAAREAAGELLGRDPDLSAHPRVATELARRRASAPVFAAESG